MSTRSKAAQDSEEKSLPKKKRGRPAKAKAEPVTEKTEDEDTDIDEPTSQATGGDDAKMETDSETKPREEPKTSVVSENKENGVKPTKDLEMEKADTEKPKEAKTTENEAGKAEGEEKPVDSEDKEKADDEKKDLVVIEDEEEEAEPEVEIIEDRDDGGEDPSEVEIEKFNMPLEQALLTDLSDMRCRRTLVVFPLKMSELSHPTLMEAVSMSTEFKTSYVKSRVGGSADTMTWVGYMELHLKSTITASDCMQSLKTVREDLTVRVLEPGENPQKLVQSSSPDFADTDSKLFNSIILARPLPEDATIATLKHLFPGATDIAFPRQVLGARMAYIIYEDNSAMSAAFDKLIADPPSLEGKQLRIMKYDTTVEWPTGLLRLKRRYRVLLQMNRLRKAIKEPQNGRYMDTMKSTVAHCKSLIEKDDAIRKELCFEVPSFAELRQYKRIREAVNEDAIWLPGKRMGGLLDRRSFVDEDEEDERYRRSRRGRGIGEASGIPSLMSVGLDPTFNPVARAQVIAHQIARMAVAAAPPAGPNPPLLRGGPPFGGPRGMMRGPRPMRGGPMGGFPGGRGGFHGDGPPHDDMMGWRGGRGMGFGRGGFGRGRGGFRGGDDGGFGGRGGGRFNEGFNKRPRSPPSRGGAGGGFRGGRDSSGEAPFKMSRGGGEAGRGRPQQRGRGGSSGPPGGHQQNRGGGASGGSRWGKPASDQGGQANRPTAFSSANTGSTGATSTAASGGYNKPPSSGGYSTPSTGYSQSASVTTAGGYSATSSQPSYGQANYGQQAQQQQQYQQQQQMSYNTAAGAAATGYGQTAYTQPTTGYPQQQQQQQQAQANTAYTQQATNAYMQGTAYNTGGAVQTGYGQADASAAYSQTPNVYAGYTQQTGTEYYQTAAGGYQSTTGQQMTGAQQTAAQGWGVMAQQATQQQQQYWPTQQQAAAWPTTVDPNAQAAQVTDPNAAAAAYAAAAYNWPTGWPAATR